MPTQEERLSTLERNMTNLNGVISDISHNETMLLGMAMKQAENIREIKSNLVTVNERLGSVETTLSEHTTILAQHTTILEEHTGRFDHIETTLAQILARLPEKP